MNRIIILGNGFDLAHKLPTSYSDFLLYYFRNATENLVNGVFQDHLIYLKLQGVSPNMLPLSSLEKWANDMQHVSNSVELSYKASFFEQIIKGHALLNGWVDLEYSLFTILREISANPSRVAAKQILDTLFFQWTFLKSRLSDYISFIERSYEITPHDGFKEIISRPIVENDLQAGVRTPRTDTGIYRCIINFNYTNTIDRYSFSGRKIQIVNIHGSAGSKTDDIIFGYGNEHDMVHSRIEEFNLNVGLKFMKSNLYHKNSRITEILRFIYRGDYQVFSIGHSLGISDSTLLSMIFNHPNCRGIRVFPKDIQNYEDISINASRHFRDKSNFLLKFLPFDINSMCPQGSSKKIV